jgi:MFS family permease
VEPARRNLIVLAACQALLFATNSTLIAVAGLAGFVLASDKSLATFTVTAWVLGTALATVPMSLLMKHIGRRGGFVVGTLVAALGAVLAGIAIHLGSFWLLCAAMIAFGVYNASAQFYRFTAADSAPADSKATAISLVLAGGLVGGLVGPEISKLTVDLFQEQFLGTYLSLLVYFALVLAILTALRVQPPSEAERQAVGRPLGQIAAQPAFAVAVLGAALGFGVMNFLMVATPIAMSAHGHHYGDAAFVIQSHVIAMFAPSFFTGALIKRFGVLSVMLAGVVALACCIVVALADVSVAHFWLALVLLGIGWNFLYIGGTTLLTETYGPAERNKTQGLNDLIVYTTQAVTSLASGWMLSHGGWTIVNYLAVPLILAMAVAIVWLMLKRRAPVQGQRA